MQAGVSLTETHKTIKSQPQWPHRSLSLHLPHEVGCSTETHTELEDWKSDLQDLTPEPVSLHTEHHSYMPPSPAMSLYMGGEGMKKRQIDGHLGSDGLESLMEIPQLPGSSTCIWS